MDPFVPSFPVVNREWPIADRECLEQYRRAIEENTMMVWRSCAMIASSFEAIRKLDHLQKPSGVLGGGLLG